MRLSSFCDEIGVVAASASLSVRECDAVRGSAPARWPLQPVQSEPRGLRRLVTWTLLATAVGIVLWLPPLIEEIIHSPGNLSIIQRELTHPPQPPIGVRRGLELLLVHLKRRTATSAVEKSA